MSEIEQKTHVGKDFPLPLDPFSYILGPKQKFMVGNYLHETGTALWQWSDEVFNIHGFEPAEIVPTTGLVMAHKHPEDRESFDMWFTRMSTQHGTSTCHHRIIDAQGIIRNVVMTAETITDRQGTITGLKGSFLDLTNIMMNQTAVAADEAVISAREKRGCIEQAKGMLMMQYQIDEETAFATLSYQSQRDHRKLRDIAEELVATFSAGHTEYHKTRLVSEHPSTAYDAS